MRRVHSSQTTRALQAATSRPNLNTWAEGKWKITT